MQTINKGQVIHTAHGTFVVSGCGNGRYTGSFMGSKTKHSILCAELHADLEAGRAFLGNAAAYRQHETASTYTNMMTRHTQAMSARSVV